MTERVEDKSNDCGKAISDLERCAWNELLNAFQINDASIHRRGPRFLGTMGKRGRHDDLLGLTNFTRQSIVG